MTMLPTGAAHRRGIDDGRSLCRLTAARRARDLWCCGLEVHATATAWNDGVLRLVGDDGLDGEEQRGDRGGVLQR
jgi:hypothetical protein